MTAELTTAGRGSPILAALQASPYPEVDLTSPRVPVTKVQDAEF